MLGFRYYKETLVYQPFSAFRDSATGIHNVGLAFSTTALISLMLVTSLLQKKSILQTYMKHIGYILFTIPDKLQIPKPIKYNTNRQNERPIKLEWKMLKQLSPEQYELDCKILDQLLSKLLIKKIFQISDNTKKKNIQCSTKHL